MTVPESPDPLPPARPRRWKRWLVIVPLAMLSVVALYTWLALHWDYSNGNRSGLLQKFSRRGWICKTYEGELWQSVVANVAPNIWYFSVREPRIARQLDSLVGREVRLHYTEHRGVPTNCFGDTDYYVDSVTVVGP
jgi:hypothetical protein